jgi:hypothetical protein
VSRAESQEQAMDEGMGKGDFMREGNRTRED